MRVTGERGALELLRGLSLFAALAPDTLQAVADLTVRRRVRAKEVLFRRGDPCQGLYVLASGTVQVYRANPDGREQVLHIQGPGQALAEVPLFDGGPYPASARVLTPGEVWFLSRAAFAQLCLQQPEFAGAIIRDLGSRLRRLISLLEKVSLKTVPARVAATVLEVAEGAGSLVDGGSFTLGVTQEQLARTLATTREGVGRALAELRRAGIIEQRGSRLRILDVPRLAARARGEAP